MSLKRKVKFLLHQIGLDIVRLDTSPLRLRKSPAESYRLISRLGFRPNTVIDIGVAEGTNELYQTFPKSEFLLIEPLQTFESNMVSILKMVRGSYVLAAAGSRTGSTTFNVHHDHLQGSSIFKECMGSEADGSEITVPVVRVDDLVKERGLTGPFLIKIDVQGAELEALEGAQQTMLDSEVIALEVSMFSFMSGAPVFFDVLSYMQTHGFVAFDILLGWNRPLDGALGQLDIVFVKEHGRFREDHAYATPDQVQALPSTQN